MVLNMARLSQTSQQKILFLHLDCFPTTQYKNKTTTIHIFWHHFVTVHDHRKSEEAQQRRSFEYGQLFLITIGPRTYGVSIERVLSIGKGGWNQTALRPEVNVVVE